MPETSFAETPAPPGTHHAQTEPLPIPYTAEEVARTFAALLETFDFTTEMRDLQIGKLNLLKRARAKKLLTAVCIALWHVALQKSFPNDAKHFFNRFVATYPPLTGNSGRAKDLRFYVATYDALVSEKKDNDFSLVAGKLATVFAVPDDDRKRLQLKLSLRIRVIYELIFKKLI